MPELVRLYVRHVAIGFLLALIFTGLLLWLDIGNLWHLVRATDAGPLAVVMLIMANAIMFSGMQFGYAVMRMGHDDGAGGGKKTRRIHFHALRVTVASKAPERR